MALGRSPELEGLRRAGTGGISRGRAVVPAEVARGADRQRAHAGLVARRLQPRSGGREVPGHGRGCGERVTRSPVFGRRSDAAAAHYIQLEPTGIRIFCIGALESGLSRWTNEASAWSLIPLGESPNSRGTVCILKCGEPTTSFSLHPGNALFRHGMCRTTDPEELSWHHSCTRQTCDAGSENSHLLG